MKLWDVYARVYDALPRFYRAYGKLVEDVVATIQDAVPAGGRILDAGCGTGNFSIELARRGYVVEGIDFTVAMLERARRKAEQAGLSNVAFRHWDMDDGLKYYVDDSFDCVLSVHALYALREPEKAMREYCRVLKLGGRLVLAEPRHPIRVIPVAKEIYREGGPLYMAKLAATQLGVGILSGLIGGRLESGRYRYWNEEELRSSLADSCLGVNTMISAYATKADLLVTASKPKYYVEMSGYRFVSAEDQESLNRIWRLRHQVYSVELGYEPQSPSGYESDEYDDFSAHFLAVDRSNDAIATIRVVLQNPRGLPMESDFSLSEYMRANGLSTAVEAGRFIIHKNVARDQRSLVAFGLFRCLYDFCVEMGINDIFTTTWPKVMNKYKMPGFEQIGEPFLYSRPQGSGLWVVPMHCDVRRAYEAVVKSWQDEPGS